MSKREKNHKITVEVPKKQVVRSRWITDRKIIIDFRGIRNRPVLRKNILGNKGAFETAEQLEEMCAEYFESCNGPLLDKYGEVVRHPKSGEIVIVQVKPYTIAGLALHLGITTTTLLNYQNGLMDDLSMEIDDDRQISQVIQRAKQQIACYAEGRLYDRDGFNGAKLVLDRAFGYLSSKEIAEIIDKQVTSRIREEEWRVKKQLIEDGDDPDSNVTIRIVRATKPEED